MSNTYNRRAPEPPVAEPHTSERAKSDRLLPARVDADDGLPVYGR